MKNTGGTIFRSAEQGLFEVGIEIQKTEKNKVTVTKILKYNGYDDIKINHSVPLISLVVTPKGKPATHTFNDILMSSELHPNKNLVYGRPVEIPAKKGGTEIHVLAQFTYNEKKYDIPLKVNY